MVSYEEAIANLERAYLILDEAASRDKGISSDQTFRCCGAVHDMLTLLKEPEPVKPTWINVKDKMPMLVETVLFTGKRYDGGWFGTKRGYFDGTSWHADDVGTIYAFTPVTHWRPLPGPPEEDE